MGLVPLLEETGARSSLSLSAIWGRSKKATVGKPEGGPSPEPNHAGTVTSDFPAQSREK